MAGAARSRPLLADVVRSELRRAILDGEFSLGAKLPNEAELCVRFGVSRITLREAIGALVEDGYVVRRQGSGTYVSHRPILRNSLDTNFSYTEYLQECGVTVRKKVLGVRTLAAEGEPAQRLGVPAGTALVEVRRVRIADRRPAIYSVDTIPAEVIGATSERTAFAGSLYRLLAEHGHVVDHAEAMLVPVVADQRLAQLLEVAEGTPLQHLSQVDMDAGGRAVMFSLEWHVPSVMGLQVYRRGPGATA